MTLQWRKDTGRWRFRHKRKGPDGTQEDLRLTLEKGISERAARRIERALLTVLKYHDFQGLNEQSRRACIQLFKNRGWTLPPALINSACNHGAAEELSLAEAIEYCLADPESQDLADPTRPRQSFVHVLSHWGGTFPVKNIRIREIKEYMAKRRNEGAAAATVNRERSALSKMFRILIQGEHLDRNPVKETTPADEREGQRDAYISHLDFLRIMDACSLWTRSIFHFLYYTGMRRKEALELEWKDVNLGARMIVLGLTQTKERRGKRVPIHLDLVPVLEEARRVKPTGKSYVFLNPDGSVPHEDSLSRAWRTAVKSLGFDPHPTVHDLRHTWKTNAMRSQVHPMIADLILGHGNKKRSLESLYLNISDADLLAAIDRMRFDIGETEIRVTKRGNGKPR